MELNSEKARWQFIENLRNKEKTQTKIQSLLNKFGNKIKMTREIANLLIYRFSTLREFIGLQQKTTFLRKLLREGVSSSDI